MTQSAKKKNDFPIEDSVPDGGASLESILCTEELQSRPSRPPDYEEENRALVKLMSALADSPSTILQTLAETILDITQCDSAGLSLLTIDGKTPDACGKSFFWPAIAGMWNPDVGGGTPRNFGACWDVLGWWAMRFSKKVASIQPRIRRAAVQFWNEFILTTDHGWIGCLKKQFTKSRTSKTTFALFFRMEPRNTFTWLLIRSSTKAAKLSSSSAHQWMSRSSIRTGRLWKRHSKRSGH